MYTFSYVSSRVFVFMFIMRCVASYLLLFLVLVADCIAAVQYGYSHIVEKTLPAVVTVRVKGDVAQRKDPMDEIRKEFRDLFGGQLAPRDNAPQEKKTQFAQGSGFIIREDGLIVTSRHNIVGATEITVSIGSDENRLKAELVGQDSITDIALLRVHTKNKLPFLTFGDSDKIKAGDIVIAIGSTFGLNGTVTAGIVSNTSRNIEIGGYHFGDLIQTDASIYFGNSGGPMLNVDGEVIGVNFALMSPAAGAVGSVGVGFAIPSNVVSAVVKQLMEKGEVSHGYIGILGRDVTPKLAEAMKLPKPSGVLVVKVLQGGGAQVAGLVPGDVVLEVNDKSVDSVSKLRKLVSTSGVGQKVKLKVIRKGQELVLYALTHKNVEEAASSSAFFNKETGLSVRDLLISERVGGHSATGVVVSGVEKGSMADYAGIMVNDIIQEVNEKPIKNIKDFEAVCKGNERLFTFGIMRDGSKLFMYVDMPD